MKFTNPILQVTKKDCLNSKCFSSRLAQHPLYIREEREDSEISQIRTKIYFCGESKSKEFQRCIGCISDPVQLLQKTHNRQQLTMDSPKWK